MAEMTVKIFYILSLFAIHISCKEIRKPHIVVIMGDDLGWDDISLHGSNQILTPNIDMLGYQGVIIPKYYTDAQGTPSRSALFTGKYPMRMGTQGISIEAAEDRGVPISEQLLPSYLKDLDYSTHLVGKWQLGKSREHYLPTKRGFDSFYGFTDGSVDYYTYNHVESFNGTDLYGLNLFHNLEPVEDVQGHLTKVLTDQAVQVIKHHDESTLLYLHVAHAAAHVGGGLVNLQAPAEDVLANSHIAHSARRLYAGLVTGLDKSVGKIIAALADKNILNNTLIIFVSDNGAPSIGVSRNYGSNLPLRGTKATPWEGAVRSTAIMWHVDIEPKIWNGLFHVTDWLPTILAAAGANIASDIDGINQWPSLVHGENPSRTSAIIAVDDLKEWGAYRDGDFKLVIGNVGSTCGYYGRELDKLRNDMPSYEKALFESETAQVFSNELGIGLDLDYAIQKRDSCNLHKHKDKIYNTTTLHVKEFCVPTKDKGCLYNITADPEEANDLWDELPEVAQPMTFQFRLLWEKLVPRSLPVFDYRADPTLHNYVWQQWLENTEELPSPPEYPCEYPIEVTTEEIKYFADVNGQVLRDTFRTQIDIMTKTYIDNFSILLSPKTSSVRHRNEKRALGGRREVAERFDDFAF